MSYNFQKQIDFLLEYACPSIKYLVYRDMLDTPVDEPFMVALQNEILAQSNTQKHLSAQHPDGWFGHELHGIDGMDCHIGGLLNLGVEASHPEFQKAITALLTPEIASAHKNWFRGGAALDAEGRGGDRAIVANILAMTKSPEDIPVFAEHLSLAFEHLSAVLQYDTMDALGKFLAGRLFVFNDFTISNRELINQIGAQWEAPDCEKPESISDWSNLLPSMDTAPLTDFENHIVSYQNLIEKADKQCKNTYDYLLSSDEAIIYNQDASIKTKINMREIKDVFTISVTIDNINDYAARAEKLGRAVFPTADRLICYAQTIGKRFLR